MHITESEQKIMNLLWEEGSLSTMQIVEKLEEETGWSKQAVISFLKRLETKKIVTYKKIGRAKYYSPIPEQDVVAREERENFLQKFYKGKLGLMVSSMAEENSLTAEDINDLRKLLDDLSKDNGA